MRINDQVLKCVVFVGAKKADGTYVLFGTAFIVARRMQPFEGNSDPTFTFFVTARHVVDGISSLGLQEVHLRINRADGTSEWIATNIKHWRTPSKKTVDVAMLPHAPVPKEWDHLSVLDDLFCSPKSVEAADIGLGDEVLIVGLFKHHSGESKNEPIVRVGNISALEVSLGGGRQRAHLIEARSIGGLSGSPVFLNLGQVRSIGGSLKVAPGGTSHVELFGLIHGHYDEVAAVRGSEQLEALTTERVNTGIAIIVPIDELFEVMDDFVRERGYSPLTL